jgi:hypothetical protein
MNLVWTDLESNTTFCRKIDPHPPATVTSCRCLAMKPFAQYVKADSLVETAVEGDPAPGYTVGLRFGGQCWLGNWTLMTVSKALSSYCPVMFSPMCAIWIDSSLPSFALPNRLDTGDMSLQCLLEHEAERLKRTAFLFCYPEAIEPCPCAMQIE